VGEEKAGTDWMVRTPKIPERPKADEGGGGLAEGGGSRSTKQGVNEIKREKKNYLPAKNRKSTGRQTKRVKERPMRVENHREGC